MDVYVQVFVYTCIYNYTKFHYFLNIRDYFQGPVNPKQKIDQVGSKILLNRSQSMTCNTHREPSTILLGYYITFEYFNKNIEKKL